MTERPLAWPRDHTLKVEGIHARRAGVEVLRGIDLTFTAGSRNTVIGRSGSGKTTLLRLLNRLSDPSGGRITLGGVPFAALPVIALRRRIGLVFQAPRPLPGTVREAMVYPHILKRTAPPADLPAALEEVGLDPLWIDREASALSGGERQRLALAVALQLSPTILALDEPTSALDPSSARRISELLRRRTERDGLTTIAVTHSREHAAWLGDRTIVLESGLVIDDGPTDEVLARADASFWAEEAGR